MVNGKHVQPEAWSGRVASAVRHEFIVEAQRGHFRVSFDGKTLTGSHDKNAPVAGGFSVWTEVDSVTYFDGLTVGRM